MKLLPLALAAFLPAPAFAVITPPPPNSNNIQQNNNKVQQDQQQDQRQQQDQQQQQKAKAKASSSSRAASSATGRANNAGVSAAALGAPISVINSTVVPADPLLIPYAPSAGPSAFYGVSCQKPNLSLSGGVGGVGTGYSGGASRTDYTILAGINWPLQNERCRQAEAREAERQKLRIAVELTRLCRGVTSDEIEKVAGLAPCRTLAAEVE